MIEQIASNMKKRKVFSLPYTDIQHISKDNS